MNFTLSKEQKDIQKAARVFAEGEFDPDLVAAWDRECQFPLEVWKKASELGFIGMHIPKKYGGQELGLLENALVFEAFSRYDSSMGLTLAFSDLGSEIILSYGTDEQKQRYLPSMCRGTSILSLAYLEKGQRNGAGPFDTTAVEKGDGYRINGTKIFVYNITLAGPTMVLCQLVKGLGEGDKAAFILEKEAENWVSSVLGERVGMRMVPMGTLTFTDLRVPHGSLLGEGIDGESLLSLSLNEMNIKASVAGTGIAQGAFDMALAYAHGRKQFGRKIASFEAIGGKLADMATRIEISRLLTYRAAWGLDRNKGRSRFPDMAKMVAAETALEVARDAIHIFGGYGYIVDYKIERFYRDASMLDIIGLPGHSHKKKLASDVVGKL